jgi:ketosteroid isomerase-like protein
MSVENLDPASAETVLMLILDVKTRWSSTHQMLRVFQLFDTNYLAANTVLGRALRYRVAVDNFVSRERDLHPLTLSNDDWAAIALVAKWLESFRDATTQMSATKIPMTSTTHIVFRGLQEDIRDNLRRLPEDIAPAIKKGLLEAHTKLSDSA